MLSDAGNIMLWHKISDAAGIEQLLHPVCERGHLRTRAGSIRAIWPDIGSGMGLRIDWIRWFITVLPSKVVWLPNRTEIPLKKLRRWGAI